MASEGSLSSDIASLALWKDATTSSNANGNDWTQHGLANAMATHANRLYLLNPSQSVTAVNLAPTASNDPVFSKDLEFTSPLNFAKKSIHLNKFGQLLAIVGSRNVAVVEVPILLEKDDVPALCKTKIITASLSLDEGIEIVKVTWHPLSNIHLVVLTNDNTLRVFNVEILDSGAEQTYNLEYPSEYYDDDGLMDLEIVSFCFGDASCASWQAFTVYLLDKSSEVFALCPVVPYDTKISSHYFTTLRTVVQKQRTEVMKQIESISSRESRQSGGRHRGAPTSPSKPLDTRRLYLESQIKWISAVTGEVDPSRPIAESTLEVLSHNPNSKKLWFDVVLQGPLDTEISAVETPQSAAISSSNVPIHDIFALSAVPALIGRSHSSGHVELLVLVNHQITPSWSVPNTTFRPNLPKLILWAGVDLSTHSGDQKAEFEEPILQPTPPTLLSGLSEGSAPHFYLYGSCGLVKVNIPWLCHVDSILSEKSRSRESPATTIQLIWNCVTIDQPLPRLIGVAPYVRPLSSKVENNAVFVLLRHESSNQFVTVSVPRDPRVLQKAHQLVVSGSITEGPASSSTETQDSNSTLLSQGVNGSGSLKRENDEGAGYRIQFDEHFGDSLPVWAAPSILGPKTFRGSGPTEAMSSNHNLQFYQHISKQFDTCHQQLEEMADNMQSRIETLAKLADKDSREYETQCARLAKAADSEVSMVTRLQSYSAIHEGFVQRLEAVKVLIRFAADRDLPIDAAWMSELAQLKEMVTRSATSLQEMEANMNAVMSDMKRAKLSERGIPELDEQQASLYVDTLQAQDKSISALVASIKKMQTKLGELESVQRNK